MVSFVAKGSSVSRLFACCLNLKVYDSLDGGANWRYIATEERTNAALSKMSFPAQPAARGYSRLVSVRALPDAAPSAFRFGQNLILRRLVRSAGGLLDVWVLRRSVLPANLQVDAGSNSRRPVRVAADSLWLARSLHVENQVKRTESLRPLQRPQSKRRQNETTRTLVRLVPPKANWIGRPEKCRRRLPVSERVRRSLACVRRI